MTKAKEIAGFLGLPLEGCDIEISHFSQVSDIQAGTVVFAKRFNEENARVLAGRDDVLAIVTKEYEGKICCPHIISENPRLDFIKVLSRFFAPCQGDGRMHPTAVVEDGAVIGSNVTIGAHCFVSSKCSIGDNTLIHPNVTLENEVIIGCNCEIKSGAVLGQDGFGFERDKEGKPVHFPHYGRVVVKDNVFVGANSCIDRGALGDTVVESDVKIANLVHIAHNCHIGEGSFLIASAVLCGGTQVGRNCWIAPNVSIREHTVVGDDALIGLGTVVVKDVAEGTVVAGNPAVRL